MPFFSNNTLLGAAGAGKWSMPSGALFWLYGNAATIDGKWKDQVGSRHADVLNNAVLTADGIQIFGDNDRGLMSSHGLQTSGTICCWVYSPASIEFDQYVFYHRTGADPDRIALARYRSADTVSFGWLAIATVEANVTSIATNQWVHLSLTWDKGQSATVGKIYKNAELSYTNNALPSFSDAPAGTLTIGNTEVNRNLEMVGKIDDVMGFSRPLTAAELQSIIDKSPGTHK